MGQEDASPSVSSCYQRGKGTGARGAPIPEVGRGTKIKRVEYRSPVSHSNEGLVNSR